MKELAIIGAGFVGVAHAAFLSKFYPVVNLIDKDEALIEKLKSGHLPFSSSDNELRNIFADAITKRKIRPASDMSSVPGSNSIYISISFDFTSDQNGYENLQNLVKKIAELATSGSLIILETTVPPGTSEKIVLPALLNNSGKKFNYIYSYERVMPGPNYLKSVEQLPKIYASLDGKSAQKYQEHLKLVYSHDEHVRMSNLVSAETAKVFENTYRMMNIALVQEFTEFALRVGANTPDILDCIRGRSTHSNIRYSGLAPGGYCLTKDPSFLIKSSDLFDFKFDFPILKASIQTTEKQNIKVLEFLRKNLSFEHYYQFFGISYLSGVGDLRESSALWIYKNLLNLGYKVSAIDSYCEQFSDEVPGGLKGYNGNLMSDRIVLATRHPEISINDLKKSSEIIDINSCLSKFEKEDLRMNGNKIMQYGEYE